MSNKLYDILKYVTMIVLPAITTLYGVIGTTLNIPFTQEVITIGVAVTTCLGTCLGISNMNYKKNN